MRPSLPLLVFSDLDGTLLDHETYQWDAAAEALGALRRIGAGVILASSKTAAEMHVLQAEMGLSDWPAIVENGAGQLGTGANDQPYKDIRRALDGLPADLRAGFTGFGDLDASEVAKITGLTPAAAELAKTRQFSEPGTWHGTPQDKQTFLQMLATKGVFAREGGRFLTLSFGKTKADQMDSIIAAHRPRQTIALGDAPNDIEMLEKADTGVIVANPHRPPLPPLPGEKTGTILRTTQPGPVGWNGAVLELLCDLHDTKG